MLWFLVVSSSCGVYISFVCVKTGCYLYMVLLCFRPSVCQEKENNDDVNTPDAKKKILF